MIITRTPKGQHTFKLAQSHAVYVYRHEPAILHERKQPRLITSGNGNNALDIQYRGRRHYVPVLR